MNQKLPMLKLSDIQVATLSDCLAVTYGNQAKLAKMLNLNRGTLRRYLEQDKEKLVRVDVTQDGYELEFING